MTTPTVPQNPKIVRDLMNQLPYRTLAVDPGETCGLVYRFAGVVECGDPYRHHLDPFTRPASDALHWFENNAIAFDRLIIEEYRVYPGKEMIHSGQRVLTAEILGGFLWIAERRGLPVVQQPASIKETTAAMLRSRGIQLIGDSRHAKDAELHLWYPTLRNNYKQPTGGPK